MKWERSSCKLTPFVSLRKIQEHLAKFGIIVSYRTINRIIAAEGNGGESGPARKKTACMSGKTRLYFVSPKVEMNHRLFIDLRLKNLVKDDILKLYPGEEKNVILHFDRARRGPIGSHCKSVCKNLDWEIFNALFDPGQTTWKRR